MADATEAKTSRKMKLRDDIEAKISDLHQQMEDAEQRCFEDLENSNLGLSEAAYRAAARVEAGQQNHERDLVLQTLNWVLGEGGLPYGSQLDMGEQ